MLVCSYVCLLVGKLRCSYLGYNQLDELEAAQCLSFNCAGNKLYTCSSRMIRCFDVSDPGRRCVQLPTSASRRDTTGQKGILSAISFCPDFSGLYAVGSYSQSVCLYAEGMRAGKSLVQLPDCPFGVTKLRWSPCGNFLWIGGRKHPDLVCWDVRFSRTELGR